MGWRDADVDIIRCDKWMTVSRWGTIATRQPNFVAQVDPKWVVKLKGQNNEHLLFRGGQGRDGIQQINGIFSSERR